MSFRRRENTEPNGERLKRLEDKVKRMQLQYNGTWKAEGFKVVVISGDVYLENISTGEQVLIANFS